MRQVDGDEVPGDDQRNLRVPDERRVHDAYADLVASGAEDVPLPAEGIRNVGDYSLPLDEQVRIVVDYLVGDHARHERAHVGGRKPPETHPTPAKELAELYEAKINGEERHRQHEEPHVWFRGVSRTISSHSGAASRPS